MKLEDILEMWSEDCNVNRLELGEESLKLPKLHSKYLRIYTEERLLLKRLEEERKELVLMKHDYYRGIMPEEDLKANGWEPFRLNIIKSDLPMYLDADQDIIKLNLRVAMQQEKVDALESIIRSINNRGYLIKNAIEYEKFKVGA
jgi:Recombination, repair and ssDNA binding protein UvsY